MKHSAIPNTSRSLLLSCLLLVLATAHAQSSAPQPDHLFAPKRGANLTMAVGVPLNGVAELAYGVSDKVTIGVLAGTSWLDAFDGYGIRVRSIVAEKDTWRVYLETPLIIYPETRRTRKPWFLVYPAMLAEKRLPSGVRLAAGTGLFLGGCIEPLLGGHNQMTEEEHAHLVAQDECTFGGNGNVMGAMWTTLNTAVAVPLSPRMTYFLKLDLVVAGIRVGEMHAMPWFYSPALMGATGIAYCLSAGKKK